MRTYIFIDLETSGLDPNIDRIVEIGWMYADRMMRRISTTCYTPVQPVGAALDRIHSQPVVFEMHSKTGLLEVLTENTNLPLIVQVERDILSEMDEIEERYQEFRSELDPADLADPTVSEHMEFVLAGKNVHFDKSFIDRYMPILASRLSYRTFDETSLRYTMDALGIAVNLLPNEMKSDLQRHRAGFDVEVTYTTMKFIINQLASTGIAKKFSDNRMESFSVGEDGEFQKSDLHAELDEDLRKLSLHEDD